MAKERVEPCKYYTCEGNCTKGREGTHHSYCQKCSKYDPRVKRKHINMKKDKLDKIRKKESFNYV